MTDVRDDRLLANSRLFRQPLNERDWVFVVRELARYTGKNYYPQTAAELAAGVTPVDYSYEPGDARRYGVVGDGSADDTAAINNAVAANANGSIDFGSLTCKTTAVITLTDPIVIKGYPAYFIKYHTGNLFLVNSGLVEFDSVTLDAAVGTSTTYGTSGSGISVSNDVGTTPYFRAHKLTIENIDSGGLKFGIDAGSQSSVTDYRYSPYTSTAGSEGKAIITSTDTAARPRFFANINCSSGIIQTGGAKDNSYVNVFCRRIEHNANDDICVFVSVRYGNLGNAITLDGETCHWSMCSFSAGPLTLAATMVGCTVQGAVTSGSIVDNTTQGNILVDLWTGSLRYTGNTLTRCDLAVGVNGDAALTMAITTPRQQVWNTPLTAARNCNLPSTSLFNGNEIHVVRTAAATGAFNLNVNGNGGLLKALGIGTWCRAVCDGTTWYLSAYGAL